MTTDGYVYLIGAGPGAPDLLTIRALRAIERCDLLLCDTILGEHFLADAGVDLAGKQVEWLGHCGPVAGRQEGVNQRLVDEASSGRIVARIKNGDPLVFGRGGEEAAFLDQHQVGWEFIPGLSATISVLTNAGYAVTNRGRGRDFAIASARCAGGGLNPDLPQASSLIILMGFRVMADMVAQLLAREWPPETPALVMERGCMPFERRVEGTLATIISESEAMAVTTPAILVVGAAASEHFRSPLRPRVLFVGRSPSSWRHLGDLLHWPCERPDAIPAGPPPAHELICFEDPVHVAAYRERYGDPIAPVITISAMTAQVARAAGLDPTVATA